MEISLRAGTLADQAVDAVLIPVDSDRSLDRAGAEIDARLGGTLRQALADAEFSGGVGTTLVIPTLGRLPARRVVVSGVGTASRTPGDIRRAWSVGARAARDAASRSVASAAPSAANLSPAAAYRAAVEGVRLGTYEFNEYRTMDVPTKRIESFTFIGEMGEAQEGIDLGNRVADGVCLARDLVNQPPDALYPERLAEIARDIAAQHGLDCLIYDTAALEGMGAGAILAVGKGSARAPRLIHLTYAPKGTSTGAVALVGKAITFDTGGVNLKPTGSGLEHMKSDMAGGAAVLGAMRAVASLGLPLTVHGVIASAENMLSGRAFRPGDVIKAMNGKTIEVISTDAEGRLVLADALTYIARKGVGAMIDLATLTGACVVALGQDAAGVFGSDDALIEQILRAAAQSDEKMWHMPLWDEYRELIKGDVADVKNSGGRPGGAITAALFINEFTEGVPWVHLDIAGPAWSEKVSDLSVKGGTGHPVRTLLTFLENRARA